MISTCPSPQPKHWQSVFVFESIVCDGQNSRKLPFAGCLQRHTYLQTLVARPSILPMVSPCTSPVYRPKRTVTLVQAHCEVASKFFNRGMVTCSRSNGKMYCDMAVAECEDLHKVYLTLSPHPCPPGLLLYMPTSRYFQKQSKYHKLTCQNIKSLSHINTSTSRCSNIHIIQHVI